MKTPVAGLALAALAVIVASSGVCAEEGGGAGLDVGRRAERVSSEQKAVLPDQKPVERNEVLMDKQVERKIYDRKGALVGERRSSIEMKESRDKQMFVGPDQKHYDTVERKESLWNGQTADRFVTGDNGYRSKSAIRFQDKIADASPVVDNVKPVVSQRTTFDRVNRFSFRRNPDPVGVKAAGSQKAEVTSTGGDPDLPDGMRLGPIKIKADAGGSSR